MPKRKRVRKQPRSPWEVIQITSSLAHFIGVVYAADEQAAKATAIEQFGFARNIPIGCGAHKPAG
jgi:hypothetical protein